MILITLSGFGGATNKDAVAEQQADPFEPARETLEHDSDVASCRAALQQVNVAPGNQPDDHRPTPDPKALERLQKDLSLDDDALSEVGADNYTLLDGWHLAGAFLFRDAATHALEPEQVGIDLPRDRRPTPLERATAAFAWAVREVRLAPPTAVGLTPPQFVVRRGSGTPLERALVFLDLLDQLPEPRITKITATFTDAKSNARTVAVAKETKIRVDGTTGKRIGDVKKGMTVVVGSKGDMTPSIDAWTVAPSPSPSPDQAMTVTKIDLKLTVNEGGKETTVAVNDDTRITVDGTADQRIDDLKEGMTVVVEAKGEVAVSIDGPTPAVQGCLVFCDGHAAPVDPWACGVMVNGKPDVYLFDPRLGLPIPGEDGKGVATLADVCTKPDLLKRLNIDGAPAYDVTPAQAAKAELHLVCSLSALAPRMEHLQDKVLPPLQVSLYHNPDREMQLLRDAAAKMEGGHPEVKVWPGGPACCAASCRRTTAERTGDGRRRASRWSPWRVSPIPTIRPTCRCSATGCSSWSWRRGT